MSQNMVPVALDYNKVVDEQSREARFLIPFLRQLEQTQGVWIFSPEGEALGGFEASVPVHRYEPVASVGRSVGMVVKTRAQIEDALRTFGSVEPRDVDSGGPYRSRGSGFRADDSVRLAQYVRRRNKSNIDTPIISSVSLTADEFAAFGPKKSVREKESWTLPTDVTARLCRVLSPLGLERAPRENWLQDVVLKASVESVKDGLANLKFEGVLSSAQPGFVAGNVRSIQSVRLKGTGTFDTVNGQMQSLTLVGRGQIEWPEAPDRPVPFDCLIEWIDTISR